MTRTKAAIAGVVLLAVPFLAGLAFVVTRDRRGGLYRATRPFGDLREVALERIGELGLEVVTAAEASPDARLIVVRTSDEAVMYRTEDLIRGVVTPTLRIPIDGLREAQGEGVALDASGMLYLASEGRLWSRGGRIVGLRCPVPG
jgi:hypothetical protein